MVLSTMQLFQSNSTFGGLLVVTFAYWTNLVVPRFRSLKQLAYFGAIFINIVLFVTLAFRWVFAGYFPLSNLYESLLFLTWVLLTIQILAESKTQSKIIGSIIAPVCLLIISFTTFVLPSDMQKAAPLVPALQSKWLMMHVSMMMVSYATLILGSLFCVLFLILVSNNQVNLVTVQTVNNRKVESIRLGRNRSKVIPRFFMGSRVPISCTTRTIYFFPFLHLNQHFKAFRISIIYFFYNWCNSLSLFTSKLKLLNNIDVWSYRTIGLGFPFLTIGIISGAVWANESWGSYWSWDPKETWALITWLVFACYLHARITKKWEGIKAALIGTLGFFVIWICYLGVNFLGRGLHSYGWLS
jgi:cytochrome c-type biogenesis protein CcsB